MKPQSFPRNVRALGFSLIGLIASSHLCHAADYQWDVNGATADLGGTGIWNTTNTFWDDLAAGVNDGTDTTQAVTFSASHNATFAGTAGTVTFGAAAVTGAMNFNTANYIVAGTSSGNQTYRFEGLTTLPTTGITAFNQGANNNRFVFNGGINLNGSTIALKLRASASGGSASNAVGKVTGNGTLTLANDQPASSNTGRFIFWNVTNDYSGSTVVDGVVLDLNSPVALGTSTLTINATASANTTVIRNSNNPPGPLTLTNNNAMAWNGDFTFNAGSARAGSSSGTANLRDLNMGTGAVTLGGDRIVTVFANTLTVGGVIDDGVNTYSLTKAGAGRLNLDGINTYSGNTNINEGTLSILESYLDITSSVSIGSTGVLDLAFAGTDTVDKLFINGVQQTTGTWGSSASGATHVDDTHFTGSGTLTVNTAPDPLIVIASAVTETTDSVATALSIPVSNNGGTQTLTISAITIGGANASSFVVNSTLPMNIAPGGSSTIDYTFTPTTGPGAYTATFDIVSNDLTQSPKTVTLNITDNPDPWIVASTASFTNNGLAAGYTVSITNNGFAKTLNLGTVTAGGVDASTVTGITAPTSILPGQSSDILFTFTPNFGAGPYSFTLVIPSDTPGTPSMEVIVNMLVTDPVIVVSANGINYGMYTHAPGPQVQTVTVFNDGGTQNLVISGTTITGAPEFTVTSAPVSIAPGGFAPVEITFTPGSGSGRFNGALEIASNDFSGTTPNITLTAFVEPAGTVAARFDFDPNSVSGAVVDIDSTTLADVVLGSLTDVATGLGALSSSNQGGSNRALGTGINGSYLNFSCAREADAQTPLAAGGSNETTWTTVTVAPEPGGGQINFTGGSAVIDTYANTDQGSNTAASWTLYYSTDSGSTWTSLGTSAGQSTTTNGTKGPLGIIWDLSVIGNQTAPVQFALDAVSTGNTNGVVTQRGVGFDNLVITAGSVTPGVSNTFDTWALANGVAGGPNGDSDNDGIPNLVEYALNLNFAGSDGSAGTLTGNVLSFTKRLEAVANGDVSYSIETSPDLLNPWTPVTYVLPDVNDGTTISYTLPTGLGKIFARLVVTQITP